MRKFVVVITLLYTVAAVIYRWVVVFSILFFLNRVFEPYVRLEASRAKHTGGTGLGLAIARAIARANGGDIALETRPGGGLAAILRLPRRVEEKAPAAEAVLVPIHKLP